MIGKKDTDSTALHKRVKIQNMSGKLNLNDWVFEIVQPTEYDDILDLGCGRGNQIFHLREVLNCSAKIDAIDASDVSTAYVNEKKKDVIHSDRTYVHNCKFEDLEHFLDSKKYSLIYSIYALYYTTEPEVTITRIVSSLRNSGRFFFCGPSLKNNYELRNILANISGDKSYLAPTVPSIFMEEIAVKVLSELGVQIDRYEFNNPILFKNKEDLIEYWESHNLCDAKLKKEFEEFCVSFFKSKTEFLNTKRCVGYLVRLDD